MYHLLAVLDSDGAQEKNNAKLAKYFLVNDSYDFETSEASDITSPDALLLFLEAGRLDYKNFRSALSNYVVNIGGVSELSQEHKILAARHFCIARSDRDEVASINEQVEAGVEFHRQSISCREARLARVEAEIYNRLLSADVASVMAIVVTGQLTFLYTRFGIEGSQSGDSAGVFDYLNATAGKPWASTGLKAQSYTTTGMTCSQLADRCLAILRGEA